MTDLQQQIETYLRTTSIPVDVDDLVSGLEFESLTDASRRPVSQRRRPAFAFAFAAVLAVLIIGVPLIVFGGFLSAPVPQNPVTIPTAPESVTSVTDAVPTTTPNTGEPDALTNTEPVSGEWVMIDADAGLPGTPIDTVAVDASGGVWVLAHTDEPTTAQLYSFDASTHEFVQRGVPLQLTADWYTLWMEITSFGVVVSIDEIDESGRPPERLLQWDDAGWHDLSQEHSLPDLNMSIAQRSPQGDLRVAGYTPDSGPVTIDITPIAVTHSVAPEDAVNRGTPSPFTIRHAVLPVGPDGRSWFSDGEAAVAALGADGYDVYEADTASSCCYVPLTADNSGVWAYFGSDLYRYESNGWRAEAAVPLSYSGAEVVAVTATADGNIWLLGKSGAARFDPDISDGTNEKGWTVYSDSQAQATGLPRIGFQSAAMSVGDAVWVATWGSNDFSIWLHDGYEWAQVDLPETIDQDSTGFRQNTVVATDSGIWVATSTGVARFDTAP
jgi:hypothetical protein